MQYGVDISTIMGNTWHDSGDNDVFGGPASVAAFGIGRRCYSKGEDIPW